MQKIIQLAPKQVLNNGKEIPVCGLGLYKVTDQNMLQLLQKSLEVGYRHFDTAQLYKNEKCIGQCFKEIFAQKKYKREEVFITSKCFPVKGRTAVEAIQETLKDLQLDYVDLWLMHWPIAQPEQDQLNHQPIHQFWAQMEECVNKGLAKSIGVSNFNVALLCDLLSYCKIKPVINQIEVHVMFQQERVLQFCHRFHINVTAYAPLARAGDILNNGILVKIAQNHKKSVTQIMLNYLNKQLKIFVIPKTEKVERLEENFNWHDFTLSESEVAQIKSLDTKQRVVDPASRDWLGFIPIFD